MSAEIECKPPTRAQIPEPSLIENEILHPAWTETQTTFSISRFGAFGPSQLEPLFHRDYTGMLAVDIFGDENRIEALRRETHARGIVAPETALRMRPGTPGGIQVSTLSGAGTFPLFYRGRIIGHVFEDAHAKYCMLGDVRAGSSFASRSTQAAEVMETMQSALASAGMDFRDVVRTWFYIDHILDWYPTFNRVRTSFFREHGIERMPASTGIGVANFAGAALVAKAVAVKPKTNAVTVRRVDSPLQCEASGYGSSFSRAMEVTDPSVSVLYVSGTASIEPGGETAHQDSPAMQISKTMEVVDALLAGAGMKLEDLTRGIAYFRRAEHIPLWNKYCRKHDLGSLPVIAVECDICRDDLLFEIELDAVRTLKV